MPAESSLAEVDKKTALLKAKLETEESAVSELAGCLSRNLLLNLVFFVCLP